MNPQDGACPSEGRAAPAAPPPRHSTTAGGSQGTVGHMWHLRGCPQPVPGAAGWTLRSAPRVLMVTLLLPCTDATGSCGASPPCQLPHRRRLALPDGRTEGAMAGRPCPPRVTWVMMAAREGKLGGPSPMGTGMGQEQQWGVAQCCVTLLPRLSCQSSSFAEPLTGAGGCSSSFPGQAGQPSLLQFTPGTGTGSCWGPVSHGGVPRTPYLCCSCERLPRSPQPAPQPFSGDFTTSTSVSSPLRPAGAGGEGGGGCPTAAPVGAEPCPGHRCFCRGS